MLQDADGLMLAIDLMQEKLKDVEFDVVVGPESRGFIFEFPLPITFISHSFQSEKENFHETVSIKHGLEYGIAELEMHRDAIKPGQKVVIDDLIATGEPMRL